MQGDFTRYFERLIKAYNSGYRRIVSMGGTSSSKTYSELQLLYQIAIARHLKKRPVVISVVSESLPHLKLGAIRDFETSFERKGCMMIHRSITPIINIISGIPSLSFLLLTLVRQRAREGTSCYLMRSTIFPFR
jgi:hypothetical protein